MLEASARRFFSLSDATRKEAKENAPFLECLIMCRRRERII